MMLGMAKVIVVATFAHRVQSPIVALVQNSQLSVIL